MKTTLNKIREHKPCAKCWEKLLLSLGKTKSDDDDVSFLTILDSNGLEDALWCLRSTPEYYRDSRLYAVWCARQVQHLMTDERSVITIDVADRYANGEASDEEFAAACDAAIAAECDAECDAEWSAARAAAMAEQTDMFIKMCKGQAPWQVSQ